LQVPILIRRASAASPARERASDLILYRVMFRRVALLQAT
jgi:hypothetical protein